MIKIFSYGFFFSSEFMDLRKSIFCVLIEIKEILLSIFLYRTLTGYLKLNLEFNKNKVNIGFLQKNVFFLMNLLRNRGIFPYFLA